MKLLARKLREEAEEHDKQRIDVQEAQFQARKRKEAIDKAKTDQYFDSDRLKTFKVSSNVTYFALLLKIKEDFL